MSEQPKFCKDCDSYALMGDGLRDDDHVCLIHSHKKLNLVTGRMDIDGDRNCYEEREDGSPCGPHGRLFNTPYKGKGRDS